MSKYRPAVFQPTVRPDWGGTLSYMSDTEKGQILEAIIKFPTIDLPNSKFWQETVKPDLEQQYAQFVSVCEQRRRGVCNRWALHKGIDIYNTSITQEQDKNKTSNRYGIDPEEEEEEEEEDEGEGEGKNNSRNNTTKSSTTRETKKRYGEFQKVKLTADEYEKLTALYGTRLDTAIDKLDNYLAQKKKDPYASHYAVMKRNGWVYNEVFDDKGEPTGPKIIGGANA